MFLYFSETLGAINIPKFVWIYFLHEISSFTFIDRDPQLKLNFKLNICMLPVTLKDLHMIWQESDGLSYRTHVEEVAYLFACFARFYYYQAYSMCVYF